MSCYELLGSPLKQTPQIQTGIITHTCTHASMHTHTNTHGYRCSAVMRLTTYLYKLCTGTPVSDADPQLEAIEAVSATTPFTRLAVCVLLSDLFITN